MHVFVVVKTDTTLITHPFSSYFPHRPPAAVVRNKAGSLTKALDAML